MRATRRNLDEFLSNVLRGVSKIVGCNSTNLVVINEKSRQIYVQLAVTEGSYPILDQMEELLGWSFQNLSVPIEAAADSLITQVWRDGSMRETSSLAELIGSAIEKSAVERIAQVAGAHRFLLVPAVGAQRHYGVLLFEKPGLHPFSRQQREVLLRYARRIGEIIENDMLGQGVRLSATTDGPPPCLLFDDQGRLLGRASQAEVPPQQVIERLGEKARAWLRAAPPPQDTELVVENGSRVRFVHLEVDGQPAALCWLRSAAESGSSYLEDQLLQLTLGASAPAVFVDPGFRITSTNPAADKLFEGLAAELIGRPLAELFLEPDDVAAKLDLQATLPNGSAPEVRAVLRRHDGSLCATRVEALLLADDRERAVGHLVLIRGARHEDPLSMERVVQQERLATMGEMAAQLAHEIRNPLVAIGATLEGLTREAPSEHHQRMLVSASREIARMDMILRKYLSARQDVAFSQVKLRELLGDVRRLLEGARKLWGKTITVEVEPELTATLDYDSMKHVFFNLIVNALEASPEGGEVTCRAAASDQAVSLFVEDRGAGLSATSAQCLQPFFTTKKSGTGLGLPVCQKLVQAHGGLLELTNREGGGCRAVVVLPRHLRGGA